MNKFKPWKLLPIWLAISAVVIVAGIILMALLGFNTAAEMPENTQLEVKYNISVIIDEAAQDRLEGYCEDVFGTNGLTVCDMQEATGTAGTADTGAFNFYFTSDISAEKQAKVISELESKIAADDTLSGDYVEIHLTWHTEELVSKADYVWRGAIAVGIVVALVYLGIRFGVGSALTGLVLSVHDALFTVALLAIVRIPVYAAAPVFYAAAAAFLSLALWLVHCMKLRSLKKESETPLDAETSVATSYKSAWKWIAAIAGTVAFVVIVIGSIASTSVRAMVLPLLIAVAAAAYSSLLVGPALHVHVKRAFDKLSRGNKFKYVGKEKKADK